jgi:hypothetical protein
LIGLVIIGSCATVGFDNGSITGIGTILATVIVVLVLVGFVFMLTRTSADVRAIRKQLEEKTHTPISEKPVADSNAAPAPDVPLG